MLDLIKQFIDKNKLINFKDSILLGLSGGIDSTTLLYILNELKEEYKIDIIAAHLDHQWRENSYKDRIFCQDLTYKLNIPFVYKEAKDLGINIKYNGSKEEIGRIMRRFFFDEIKKEFKCNKIALAHHLDDQIETFFIKIIRGTTISGLTSIKSIDNGYIRPLLGVYKQDILKFADKNNIEYINDETNNLNIFLRNKIRNVLIPNINKIDKRFNNNLIRLINNIQEVDNYLNTLIIEKYKDIEHKYLNYNSIKLDKLFKEESFIIKNIIKLWLYNNKIQITIKENTINEIIRFLKNNKSKSHKINNKLSIIKIDKKNLKIAFINI